MLTSLDGLDRAGRATGSAEPLSTLPGMGKSVQRHYRRFKSRLYILLVNVIYVMCCAALLQLSASLTRDCLFYVRFLMQALLQA